MYSNLAPGVYIQAANPQVRALAPARTDVAAFVGIAECGPVATPTRVTSFAEYQRTFGTFLESGYLAYAVKAFFENGGIAAWEAAGQVSREVWRKAGDAISASSARSVASLGSAKRSSTTQPDGRASSWPAAVKLARLRGQSASPKRWKVVSMNKSFHGRSMAMIAATVVPALPRTIVAPKKFGLAIARRSLKALVPFSVRVISLRWALLPT